jgi:hypothetical protein
MNSGISKFYSTVLKHGSLLIVYHTGLFAVRLAGQPEGIRDQTAGKVLLRYARD